MVRFSHSHDPLLLYQFSVLVIVFIIVKNTQHNNLKEERFILTLSLGGFSS
jgi:hypothetical protein